MVRVRSHVLVKEQQGRLCFQPARGYFVALDSGTAIDVRTEHVAAKLLDGDRVLLTYVAGDPHCVAVGDELAPPPGPVADLGSERAGPPGDMREALAQLVPSAPSPEQAGNALMWLFYFSLFSATAVFMGPASQSVGMAAQAVTIGATVGGSANL